MTRINGWTSAAAGVLLLMAGCREVEVTTGIHRDGSLDRRVVVTSDEEDQMQTSYPLLGGEGWEKERRQVESEGQTRWTETYRRSFRDAESLQEVMRPDPSEPYAIRPEVELEERFRWFTTRYVWREHVPKVSPYDTIPLREWFSEAEIDSFFSDRASESLQERFETWQSRNFIEDLVLRVADHAREEGLAAWDAEQLHVRSAALFDTVMAREEELDLDDLTPAMLEALEDTYGQDASALEPAVRGWEEELMGYFEATGSFGEEMYTFRVRMPGLLVETTAREVEGNTATWDFDPERLHYADLEMRALSRVTNTWALWVTGALILLFLLVAVVYRFRRPISV